MIQYKTSALGTNGTPVPDASGTGMIEVAAPSGALAVAGGSAAHAEVVEAFKRLHTAWLYARKRSDMNEQMDALATVLQLHPHTLAPLNTPVSRDGA